MRGTLESPGNAAFPPIGVELNENLVSHQHFNAVEAHFACQIAQHRFPCLKDYSKQGIWQGFLNGALRLWCVILHQLATKYSIPKSPYAVNKLPFYDRLDPDLLGIGGETALPKGPDGRVGALYRRSEHDANLFQF